MRLFAASPHSSLPARLLLVVAIGALSACATTRDRIEQHHEKLQSLASTVDAVGNAWLDGTVSGTYARTALEQTFLLVEQERRGLTAAPPTLADPFGAQLSDAAERLARVVARLIQQVEAADAAAVRQHLAELPLVPEHP